jgi:hypothetical protein
MSITTFQKSVSSKSSAEALTDLALSPTAVLNNELTLWRNENPTALNKLSAELGYAGLALTGAVDTAAHTVVAVATFAVGMFPFLVGTCIDSPKIETSVGSVILAPAAGVVCSAAATADAVVALWDNLFEDNVTLTNVAKANNFLTEVAQNPISSSESFSNSSEEAYLL